MVYVGDTSLMSRKNLRNEISKACARVKTFQDAESLTASLLKNGDAVDFIILGDFTEMSTINIVNAWKEDGSISINKIVVVSEDADLMIDTHPKSQALLEFGIIGILSKPVRLRHIKKTVEENAKSDSVREISKSLNTLTKAQQRKLKTIRRREKKIRRKSLSGCPMSSSSNFPEVANEKASSSQRRKSFPKNLYSSKKSYEITKTSFPEVKNATETSEENVVKKENTTVEENTAEESTANENKVVVKHEPKEKNVTKQDGKLPIIVTQNDDSNSSAQKKMPVGPLLYSPKTLGEILKFSNGDRWFGPVNVLENGMKVPHGRGTVRYSPENSKHLGETFWTGDSLLESNYVWMGPTTANRKNKKHPCHESYGTMLWIHNFASWCGKVVSLDIIEDRSGSDVFNPKRVRFVGLKGVLHFNSTKKTCWSGSIDLIRGRPHNDPVMSSDNTPVREEASKMMYRNGDVWTGCVDPMSYYPIGNGTMVYSKHRGNGTFFVGKIVEPFVSDDVKEKDIVDPSIPTYSTSVRVLGEGKMFSRIGSENECKANGRFYVMSGFEVRDVEQSPKKLRLQEAPQRVKEHCLGHMSPKKHHGKTKTFIRERVDSREVMQGSSFFNDLVKRSSIRKEKIDSSAIQLKTHREITSPKRYRGRDTCKREKVFTNKTG